MRISGPVGATRFPILPPKLGPQGAVPLCRPGCGGGRHPEFSPLVDSRAFAMPAGRAFKPPGPASGELNTTNHSVIFSAPLAPADKAAGGSIESGSLEGEFTMTQRAADHGRSGPSGAPVNILRRPLERRAHRRARSQEAEAPQRCISNGAGVHHSDFTGPSSWRRP